MTILTQGDSDGERRCDAKCHTAKTSVCYCICEARYHGKGSSEAAQEQLTKDWLGDEWKQRKAEIEAAGGSIEAVFQEALFTAARG